jgi:enamine deaminase RidA (YjgF/YER057c/UK114 family)
VSGQIGRELKTGKLPENFEAEVRQSLNSMGIILREAKMSYADDARCDQTDGAGGRIEVTVTTESGP